MDFKTIKRGDIICSKHLYGPTNWIVIEVNSDHILCDIVEISNGFKRFYKVNGHRTRFQLADKPIGYYPSWDVFTPVGHVSALLSKQTVNL